MVKIRRVRHQFELRFNDDLKVYEVIELLTGRVKGNSSDYQHASSMYYAFDGVYNFAPIQLSLF